MMARAVVLFGILVTECIAPTELPTLDALMGDAEGEPHASAPPAAAFFAAASVAAASASVLARTLSTGGDASTPPVPKRLRLSGSASGTASHARASKGGERAASPEPEEYPSSSDEDDDEDEPGVQEGLRPS